MRKRVLLIDESLTVQKVVALTLDKSRFSILYAKTRAEAMRLVVENAPQLILVSDQVSDINVGAFPKEVEVWLNRRAPVPPILLITAQDLKEVRHYAAVLKKPFSPQNLQKLVTEKTNLGDAGEPVKQVAPPPGSHPEDFEDQRLQKIFHDAFSDESRLVRETLESEPTSSFHVDADEEATVAATRVVEREPQKAKPAGQWPPQVRQTQAREPAPPAEPRDASASRTAGGQEPARAVPVPPDVAAMRSAGGKAQSPIWDTPAAPAPGPEVMSSSDSHAYKAVLENKVAHKIEEADLEAVVAKVLEKMLPPIVEKLVQARLDALMKEQEQFLELKS